MNKNAESVPNHNLDERLALVFQNVVNEITTLGEVRIEAIIHNRAPGCARELVAPTVGGSHRPRRKHTHAANVSYRRGIRNGALRVFTSR